MSGLLLGLLSLFAAGFALVRWLAPPFARSAAGRVGLALLLGPSAVAFGAFLAARFGVPLGRPLAVGLAVAAFTAALFAPRPPPSWHPSPLSPRAWSRTPGPGLALCVGAPVLFGAAFAWTIPPVKDALANWSLKTKALLHDRTLRSPDLVEPDRLHFHPNYPLLVPLSEVHLSALAGRLEDRRSKVVFSFFHLGAALVLFAFLRPRMGAARASVFAALLAATPHFYRTDDLFRFAGSVPSGYADPAFAGIATGAAVLLASYLRARAPRDLAAAALLLGFAVFTKNEGLPLALAAVAGLALALSAQRFGRSRRPLPRPGALLPAAALFLVVAAPWLQHRATLPVKDEDYQARVVDPAEWRTGAWRTPTILLVTVEEALAADHHALVWPLLLLALWFGRKRLLDPEAILLLALLAVMAAVYFAVFLVTPLPIVDSLYTSIPRTFFQMTGPALLLAALLLAPDDGRA